MNGSARRTFYWVPRMVLLNGKPPAEDLRAAGWYVADLRSGKPQPENVPGHWMHPRDLNQDSMPYATPRRMLK